jgi:hypothetical protein
MSRYPFFQIERYQYIFFKLSAISIQYIGDIDIKFIISDFIGIYDSIRSVADL